MVQRSRSTRSVPLRRPRRFRVFTCDKGRRWLDVDRDPARRVTSALQEVVESGFWGELDKFPTGVIERALPDLDLPPHTKRFLEVWIEERPDAPVRRSR